MSYLELAAKLLSELSDQAEWMEQRSTQLRQLAGRHRDNQQLRDEAARFGGRASLLRMQIENIRFANPELPVVKGGLQ